MKCVVKAISLLALIMAIMFLSGCKDLWHPEEGTSGSDNGGSSAPGPSGGGGEGVVVVPKEPGGAPQDPTGGGGSLSGTYRSGESIDGTLIITITFSGDTCTMRMSGPYAPVQGDVMTCYYVMSGNIIMLIEPVWIHPALASMGGDSGDGSGDNTYFTIVNATTIRDTDGGYWYKQ
jgi:hypothetical protein